MTLRLFNTLSKEKEVFTPLDPHHIRMYVCGPTVYDFAHIGNARPVIVFDVLFRLLQTLFPKVTYVRNITDVDDKINAAAKASGESIYEITKRTTDAYHEDMRALFTLPPTLEPRATDHIQEMLDMINILVEKGFAYEVEGHVLFRRKSFQKYGHLSRRTLDDMIHGARVEVAPYKEDPADFVLWKPSKEDEPGWASDYGYGRPGWHIECSAMSKKYLSEEFDIHGGGVDLVFPHHENEIAQSCAAHDTEIMAKYWLHNGHLMVNGAKMSKSLGNFFTVRDLLQNYQGEVIRFAFLQTHYRQPLDFHDDTLAHAKSVLDRFYLALSEVEDIPNTPPNESVMEAVFDDLNAPLAISHLFELLNQYHKSKDVHILGQIKASGNVLGLFQQVPKTYLCGQLDETCIQVMLEKRAHAKKARDFAVADQIRLELEEMGIILEDLPTGTRWRKS